MRKLGELWVPAFVFVFGVAYYHSTRDLPALSSAFPRFLMFLLPTLAVAIFVTERLRGRAEAAAKPISFGSVVFALRNPIIVLGSAVLYLAVFMATNFFVATLLYLICAMVALHVPWLKAGAIALGFTSGLYGIFGYLFNVQI